MDTTRMLGLDVGRVLDIDRGCGDRFAELLSAGAPLPGECTWSKLLEECAASLVPDYVRFQNEAMSLLEFSVVKRLLHVMRAGTRRGSGWRGDR